MRSVLCCLLLLLVGTPVWVRATAPVIPLTTAGGEIPFGTSFEQLVDADGVMTLEQVKQNQNWEAPDHETVNRGFASEAVWYRFTVRNNSRPDQQWFYHISWAVLTDVRFYAPEGYYTAIEDSGHVRVVPDHNIVFPLKVPVGQEATYYLRIKSRTPHILPATIMERHDYEIYNKEDYLLFSIFLGSVLVMIIYNTLLFFTVRDKSYIPYIIYLILSLISVISLRGIGFEYLWPGSGWMNAFTRIATPAMATVFIYAFIRMFLNTKELAPRWHRVIFILQCMAAAVPLMMLPQKWDGLTVAADILMNLGLLILPIVAVIVGILAYRKGYKPATFYLVAFSFLLLGLVVQILKNLGVLGQTLFTEYFFQFGIVMEQAILSIALGDRINVFKDEKEAAQADAIGALKENERLIAEQNRFLEQKVAERTEELQHANHELAEKNDDILSSIQYAKRIQTAILPATSFIRTYLSTASVFYRPKDIVSGDFFWFGVRNDLVILAAVDCTGHGVPGAFMSVIGYNQLNRIINELGITDAGTILFELDRSIRDALHQDDATSESKDGMDVSLCVVNPKARTLQYAGANRPLWIRRAEEWEELKGDKFPIGGAQHDVKFFTSQDVTLQSTDRVVLFSDGVVDQFGGPQRRKVTPKRLREWLETSRNYSPEDQCRFVEQQFDEWKTDQEQLDDITLIIFDLT